MEALLSALRTNVDILSELALRYEVQTLPQPERPPMPPNFSTPEAIANLVKHEMEPLLQEQLRVVLLNTRNELLGQRVIYQGNVNSSMVRVAEVLRPAVVAGVPSIVIVHNHPSGSTAASPEDKLITRKIKAAAELLDIEVLDHIIIGHGRYTSMKKEGLL